MHPGLTGHVTLISHKPSSQTPIDVDTSGSCSAVYRYVEVENCDNITITDFVGRYRLDDKLCNEGSGSVDSNRILPV